MKNIYIFSSHLLRDANDQVYMYTKSKKSIESCWNNEMFLFQQFIEKFLESSRIIGSPIYTNQFPKESNNSKHYATIEVKNEPSDLETIEMERKKEITICTTPITLSTIDKKYIHPEPTPTPKNEEFIIYKYKFSDGFTQNKLKSNINLEQTFSLDKQKIKQLLEEYLFQYNIRIEWFVFHFPLFLQTKLGDNQWYKIKINDDNEVQQVKKVSQPNKDLYNVEHCYEKEPFKFTTFMEDYVPHSFYKKYMRQNE